MNYDRALKLDSEFAKAYTNLGLLYLEIGNFKAAKTNLQKARRLFLSQGKIAEAEKIENLLKQLPYLRQLPHTSMLD